MKKYAIRYDQNGVYEAAVFDSTFCDCKDEDGRFGSDDINEAYQYLNWLIDRHGDVYTVVEKVAK